MPPNNLLYSREISDTFHERLADSVEKEASFTIAVRSG